MRYLISLIFALSTSFAVADEYAPQKVVYHINYKDMSRFSATLANMANHIAAVGEDQIDLKAMVHGEAVEIFMNAADDDGLQITLDAARFNGVQFIICGNTLTGYNITYEDLYDVNAEDVVQAGLPAIIKLQQQGYFYVRP
jgi:intracellular sulfur oxidation DsrE/DsrF family protein